MPEKRPSNVDQWLKRETPRVRKALESASRHFDSHDNLTINTLEAVYGKESSFGTMLGERGSSQAAGHFHFKPNTANEYGLSVSKTNDQRFNIDYASSAAARYLKDLDNMFSKNTTVGKGSMTIPISNAREREKFILGAYNGGQTRIADAQHRAANAGKNPQVWTEVEKFLESKDTSASKADEIRHYVERVPLYEAEFGKKSPAQKAKQKIPRKERSRCAKGHWVTIEDRPVYICD